MDGLSIQAPDEGFSYIMPIGYSNTAHCGYCHGQSANGKPKKRFSYYASAHSLSPSLYQALVDRCWRRSGTLLYRPNQRHTCCPHYTLRLDSAQFHATRDQRQAANRFNRYVIGDTYAKEAARLRPRSREEAKKRDTVFDLADRIHEAESKNLGPLPPRPALATTHARGDGGHAETHPSEVAQQDRNGQDAEKAEPDPTMPAHRFEVTLEHDTFTEEKYLVYENYQRIIHKEGPSKITRKGFASFLCNSPLRRESITDPDGRQRELGSFHQCYRLDGKLVAIGVLDLLPHAVSAVYFLYHESIHQHNPGKLGALREIALALEGGYQWWYSGYYIHSCPKMRYKIDYAPQYVLDPETLAWDHLDKDALAIFDRQSYVSLSRERRLASGGRDPDTGNGDNDDDDGSGGSEDERPLLTSNMPGLPPLADIEQLNLDDIPIQTGLHPGLFPVRYLVAWEGTVRDSSSFKSKVAELVAAMGADLMPQLCLDFRRYSQPEY